MTGSRRPTDTALKAYLRRSLQPVWPWLVLARSSPPVRRAKAIAAIPAFAWKARGARGLLIDFTSPIGMGGVIAHALRVDAWAEDAGMPIEIRATSPLYGAAGEDMFATWFAPPEAGVAAAPRRLGGLAGEHVVSNLAPLHMPLARAERLFARRFRPSPRLRDAIAEAQARIGAYSLAIHFRGTDKFLESGRVGEHRMIAAVRPELDARSGQTVFLATDDAGFARRIRAEFPDIAFASYDMGLVPEGEPRHFSALSPREKAQEALVNIFLISRAATVVRTSSFLSAISRLASPDQRTMTINQTLARDTPFPEFEILEHEARAQEADR